IYQINRGVLIGAAEKLSGSIVDVTNFQNKDFIKILSANYQRELENLKVDLAAAEAKNYSTAYAKTQAILSFQARITDLENKIKGLEISVNASTNVNSNLGIGDNFTCPICFESIYKMQTNKSNNSESVV